MSTAPAKQDIFYSDRDHCIAIQGRVVLAFSLQPPHPKSLEAWAKAVDQSVHRSSGPIAVMVIVDSGSRAPDEDTKRGIQDITSRYGPSIGAFAYVIEGEGFGAAALRSAVSLISLAARYPFPQKVFKRVTDAAAWVLPHLPADAPDAVTVAGLVSAVEVVRRQLKPLAAAI